MNLPENPDYTLACELIDGHHVEFWLPVITHICQTHDLHFNHMHKVDGWANGIFDLDSGYIIKIVPPNWVVQGTNELLAFSLLEGHSLPVTIPKIIANGKINGWLYIVMDKLPGINLHDVWSDLNQENRCSIMQQVSEFATQLHAMKMPENSELHLDWPAFLQQQKDGCYEKRKHQGLSEPLLADLIPFIESVDYQPLLNSPCLIHTDLHPGNLLAMKVNNQWQLTGVIDFGDAFIGNDRYFDFATSAILMGLGNKTVNQALLDGYQFEISDIKQFQRHLMVLALLRHTGELGYLLQQVPGCEQLTDWQSIAERFFAL